MVEDLVVTYDYSTAGVVVVVVVWGVVVSDAGSVMVAPAVSLSFFSFDVSTISPLAGTTSSGR